MVSRTPCLNHPKDHPLIQIHRWQIEACDGDVCAAALLSFFEYWHSVKLANRKQAKHANDVAEMHGEDGTQNTSLFQFHSEEELERGVMIYKRNTIAKSLRLLENKDFISIHKNPNPRYKFDRTRYFLFHVRVAQDWLDEHYGEFLKVPSPKNGARHSKNGATSNGSSVTSPDKSDSLLKAEITTEITTEELDSIFESKSDSEKAMIEADARNRLAAWVPELQSRPIALLHMRRTIIRESLELRPS